MPRASIIAAGFVLAGLVGLGAYFFPLFRTAASATPSSGTVAGAVSDTISNLNPIDVAPSQPFTVLLLGSDDDSKFPADRLNTQSMILLRVDPGSPGTCGCRSRTREWARSAPPTSSEGPRARSPR